MLLLNKIVTYQKKKIVEVVVGSDLAIRGDASSTDASKQALEGNFKKSKKKFYIWEKGRTQRTNVPARRVYARRDGGSLSKGRGAGQSSILSVKKELIELREKLMGLILKIDNELGAGLSSGL